MALIYNTGTQATLHVYVVYSLEKPKMTYNDNIAIDDKVLNNIKRLSDRDQ
jgi:hypothetical protein